MEVKVCIETPLRHSFIDDDVSRTAMSYELESCYDTEPVHGPQSTVHCTPNYKLEFKDILKDFV